MKEKFMKPIQNFLEKILLTYPSINQNRILLFSQNIKDLMDKFYDEIETMRHNEYDVIMDYGIDIEEDNFQNEE